MGFLDSLWESIKRLFGGEKAEVRVERLRVSGIEDFLEQETLAARRELEKHVAERFSEIKHFLRKIDSGISELKKADFSSENKRISGIVNTSKQQTIRQLSSLSERLNPPVKIELKSSLEYCNDSLTLLERESVVFGKNIAYTSAFMKEETKSIGNNIKELLSSIKELKGYLGGQSALFSVDAILKEKQELLMHEGRVAEAKNTISSAKALVESMQKQKKELSDSVLEMQHSEGYSKTVELQGQAELLLKEKQEINAELLSMFSSIDKPLKRFRAMVEAKKIFLAGEEQARVLHLLMNEPLTAMKRDPQGTTVKEVLAEVKRALEENQIALKEGENEKKISIINQLLEKNFSDSFFWKINEVERKIKAIEKDLQASDLFRRMATDKSTISEIERKLSQACTEMKQKEIELENRKQSIEIKRENLENMLCRAFNRKIVLEMD